MDADAPEIGIRGGHRIDVEAVTLRVEPGEFVALLGPFGCSKATLRRRRVHATGARRLLVEAGFAYDSNAFEDNLPYRCPDTGMIEGRRGGTARTLSIGVRLRICGRYLPGSGQWRRSLRSCYAGAAVSGSQRGGRSRPSVRNSYERYRWDHARGWAAAEG